MFFLFARLILQMYLLKFFVVYLFYTIFLIITKTKQHLLRNTVKGRADSINM